MPSSTLPEDVVKSLFGLALTPESRRVDRAELLMDVAMACAGTDADGVRAALTEAVLQLSAAEEGADHGWPSRRAQRLGRLAERLGEPSVARSAYLLAIRLRGSGGDPEELGTLWHDVASTWMTEGAGVRALEAFRAAAGHKARGGNALSHTVTLSRLADAEDRWGDPERCTAALEDALARLDAALERDELDWEDLAFAADGLAGQARRMGRMDTMRRVCRLAFGDRAAALVAGQAPDELRRNVAKLSAELSDFSPGLLPLLEALAAASEEQDDPATATACLEWALPIADNADDEERAEEIAASLEATAPRPDVGVSPPAPAPDKELDPPDDPERAWCFALRRRLATEEDVRAFLAPRLREIVGVLVESGRSREDSAALLERFRAIHPVGPAAEEALLAGSPEAVELIVADLERAWDERETALGGATMMRLVETAVAKRALDAAWLEHVEGEAPRPPLVEAVWHGFLEMLLNIEVEAEEDEDPPAPAGDAPRTFCWCGSGLEYAACHGAPAA